MPDSGNKRRGNAFKELIVALLNSEGIAATERPEKRHNQPGQPPIQDSRPLGDVQGINGWLINVHHEVQRDLSGNIDRARREAMSTKMPYYAAIFSRHGRRGSRSYVLMEFENFIRVLKATEETES